MSWARIFIANIGATRCQILRPNVQNSISAKTPLGELTVLPQITWLYLMGLLLRKGREREGKGKEGKGK